MIFFKVFVKWGLFGKSILLSDAGNLGAVKCPDDTVFGKCVQPQPLSDHMDCLGQLLDTLANIQEAVRVMDNNFRKMATPKIQP